MEKRKTLLLILVVLLVLLAGGAWFFLHDQKPPAVLPDVETNSDKTQSSNNTTDQTPKTEAQTDDDTSAAEDNQTKDQPQEQAALRTPTFDVLRVEPDGTAVIAGAAEPLGKLDVKESDETLVSSEVTEDGNFVAIIDTPLKPGDHLIYLQVSMPDGRSIRSEQTATISIPETGNDELLAVITEPGKASEIINTPQPVQSATSETDGSMIVAENNGNTDGDTIDRNSPAHSEPNQNAGETSLSPVTVRTDGEEAETGRQAEQTAAQATDASVRIKAVEIEDDTLFVAGEGQAGALIRGYIDDAFLAESEVNVESNFVLEAKIDIPVGLHTVRADMLDDSGNVIARAVVPFDRPAGDQVAAISSEHTQRAETGSDGTQTFVQPQLEKSDNAVIIRRGDNLWRISRRFYGRGVRYTTIYLANEPQIANPNVILPGQVFSLPPEPLPIGEAESIHRRLLSGEHVSPDQLPPADR